MTSVSGDFPSSFTLQLFQPPPEDEMIPCLADDPSHPAAGRYAMGVIGSAVEAHVEGASLRAVAAGAELNEPAVRLWCRRFRERAEVAVAVVGAIAVGLVGQAGVATRSAESAILSALGAAVAVMCETESLERWSAISVLTGGMWLAPLEAATAPGSRVFPTPAEQRLMSLIDPNEPERPP